MSVRSIALFCLTLLVAAPALAAPKSATDKIADAFMDLDSDHSDGVSFAEYKAMVDARAAERFREMDRNRNGEVSDEEYRDFWRDNKAKWYRLQR